MDLLAIAIAPGIAICLFILHRDAFNREPKLTLIISFILGMATILPAIFIENAFFPYTAANLSGMFVRAFLWWPSQKKRSSLRPFVSILTTVAALMNHSMVSCTA